MKKDSPETLLGFTPASWIGSRMEITELAVILLTTLELTGDFYGSAKSSILPLRVLCLVTGKQADALG